MEFFKFRILYGSEQAICQAQIFLSTRPSTSSFTSHSIPSKITGKRINPIHEIFSQPYDYRHLSGIDSFHRIHHRA
jgi:hypothetical protein